MLLSKALRQPCTAQKFCDGFERQVGLYQGILSRRNRPILCLAGKFFQDDFPRIVDDIPRRLPNINFPALQENLQVGVKEFFLPSGLSYQELFTWRLLIAFCMLAAVTTELASLSTKTARKLQETSSKRWRKGQPQADPEGSQELGTDGLEMPEVPKTALSRERLLADRSLYSKEIRAERSRGLSWLAICTLICIWCTGILFKDNALQPYCIDPLFSLLLLSF